MFIIRLKLLHLTIEYQYNTHLGSESLPPKSLSVINIFFKMNTIVLTDERDSIYPHKDKVKN